MEAIMGVNAALVTIYDLSKIINPHLKIDNVKLYSDENNQLFAEILKQSEKLFNLDLQKLNVDINLVYRHMYHNLIY